MAKTTVPKGGAARELQSRRLPNGVRLNHQKGILLTVTSIQRAERPGDARPPENRGHVTDPPHPDPCKQERRV